MNCCRALLRLAPVIVLLALVLPVGQLPGQPKPPPLLPPNPQAPVLNGVSPGGVQRGTTVELTLTGANLNGPTGVYTSFPAKVTIPDDNKNGQDPAKLRVRLEVPADAQVGTHVLRLTTIRGISNLRLFCVDDLPQLPEVTTNRDRATPQVLTAPCVVGSRLDAEKSAWFQITVKAGERLSFDVLGRRLGGPIDPEISIYDAKTKREVAHDNDAPGCQSDPRLQHSFQAAGNYLIEVKDVLNRGGADYTFRLRVGDFPLATVPVPMAVQRGKKATVTFAGPAVAGVTPVQVEGPNDVAVHTLYVAPKGSNGLHGWPVPLTVSDFPEAVEVEAAKENRVSVPGGVTGRFLKAAETDYYLFGAKKGQKLTVEAHTLEYQSPTLVYMVLRNAKTKAEIAKSNPQAVPPADQVIEFTAPEDGDYAVAVEHLNYQGGPAEAYRLTVTPSRPTFEVSVGIDRFDLQAGGAVAVPLNLKRVNFGGPVEVSVRGPAGLTGKATIAAGQAQGLLVLQAGPEVALGPYLIALAAEATIDGERVTSLATVRPSVTQSLGGLPFPPRELNTQIAIGVREKAPFALVAKLEQNGVVAGLPAELTLSVQREPGFDEEIVLAPPANLPPGVPAPKLPNIAKGQTSLKVKLDINPKVPAGQYLVTFSGKAKHQGKDVNVTALPALLDVGTAPFELTVEPAAVKLEPGEKMKLKITAIRKGGYDGPIALAFKDLPANVNVAAATIAKGQTSVEVEIQAAANAAPANQPNVTVTGTAGAPPGTAGPPRSFAVMVLKGK
jgi:hypothetical protein